MWSYEADWQAINACMLRSCRDVRQLAGPFLPAVLTRQSCSMEAQQLTTSWLPLWASEELSAAMTQLAGTAISLYRDDLVSILYKDDFTQGQFNTRPIWYQYRFLGNRSSCHREKTMTAITPFHHKPLSNAVQACMQAQSVFQYSSTIVRLPGIRQANRAFALGSGFLGLTLAKTSY